MRISKILAPAAEGAGGRGFNMPVARTNGLAVIDKFKSTGVKIATLQTSGGHEWVNRRLYLRDITPKLFR